MCEPAPVASQLWHDTQARYGTKVAYAGIVASAQHSADCHRSGHNCSSTCGGQESPIGGKGYDPRYAHALDIHLNDLHVGPEIISVLLADPRTRYCILDGIGHYGVAHGFPGTFSSFDHTDHVHWSAMPGSTFDVRPFYGVAGGLGALAKLYIWIKARRVVANLPDITQGDKGDEVKKAQQLLGRRQTGRYDAAMTKAVAKWQTQWNAYHRSRTRIVHPDGTIRSRTWRALVYTAYTKGR